MPREPARATQLPRLRHLGSAFGVVGVAPRMTPASLAAASAHPLGRALMLGARYLGKSARPTFWPEVKNFSVHPQPRHADRFILRVNRAPIEVQCSLDQAKALNRHVKRWMASRPSFSN